MTTVLTEIALVFGLGLVSSLHCVQMCGPVVLSLGLSTGGARRQLAVAHLAYNLGRVTTYTLLGAVAGAVGGAIGGVGRIAGFENTAAIVTGSLMVLAGLYLLDLVPLRALRRLDPFGFGPRVLGPVGRRITSPSASSKFTLGLMLGLLPCGLIYAALLESAATASPTIGALTMLAFGLGTVLALMLVGLASSAVGPTLLRKGARLAAVMVLILGAFVVWRGVNAEWRVHNDCPKCHEHL
jgi:sulfite exporter TauE/SafE